MNIEKAFNNLKIPGNELPKIGQRVRVICIKEMIYLGNDDVQSSEWMDDGEGDRSVMFWEEI